MTVQNIIFWVSILNFSFSAFAIPTLPNSHPFVGKVATEALLDFDHWIEFPFNVPSPLSRNGEILLRAAAKSAIEEQLKYLFGPLYAQKDNLSAPKLDHSIEPIRITPKNGASGTYRATYHYHGTLVTKMRPESKFEIFLPLPTQPQKIFKKSALAVNGKLKYPCFSEDAGPNDYSDKYFWYFWDPDLEECPLVEGTDFIRAHGFVEIKENTRLTYPQYPDLVKNGKITISLFVGMDDSSNSRNPEISKDDAASSYQTYAAWLESNGFSALPFGKSHYWKYLKKNDSDFSLIKFLWNRPYTINEYVKKINGIQIWVRLVFSPTGLVEDSSVFWHLFRDAIENHSMMIYDGHSGLGIDLSITGLNIHGDYTLRPDPNRYQIYHFDACDSYSYYNNKYFVLKGGTKYLDIVTNGLLTDMDFEGEAGEQKKITLLKAVDDWASRRRTWSYRDIVDVVDSGNLLGVNGDEDNPTVPPEYR